MKSRVLKKDKLKRELINALSTQDAELIIFYDDFPELPNNITAIRDGVARITSPYDYDALEKWWYYGNWLLISPYNPEFEPFNTFRSSDEEISRVMEAHNVALIIDSFHDDIEWKVHERA